MSQSEVRAKAETIIKPFFDDMYATAERFDREALAESTPDAIKKIDELFNDK